MLGTYVLSAGYYDAYYRKAQQVRTLIRRDYDAAFARVDVVAMPTTPTPAVPAGREGGRSAADVPGRRVHGQRQPHGPAGAQRAVRVHAGRPAGRAAVDGPDVRRGDAAAGGRRLRAARRTGGADGRRRPERSGSPAPGAGARSCESRSRCRKADHQKRQQRHDDGEQPGDDQGASDEHAADREERRKDHDSRPRASAVLTSQIGKNSRPKSRRIGSVTARTPSSAPAPRAGRRRRPQTRPASPPPSRNPIGFPSHPRTSARVDGLIGHRRGQPALEFRRRTGRRLADEGPARTATAWDRPARGLNSGTWSLHHAAPHLFHCDALGLDRRVLVGS